MVFRTICLTCLFFFFSSRRRHTRCLSDWSSDVCSSDLSFFFTANRACGPGSSATTSAHFRLPLAKLRNASGTDVHPPNRFASVQGLYFAFRRYMCRGSKPRFFRTVLPRSEERRVGKECRSAGS